MTRETFKKGVQILVLAALYFATARLSLRMDAVGGVAVAVWPPAGLSLVALFLVGRSLWPGILLGAIAANFTAGAPFWVAFGIGVGNTLEALLGASLLLRVNFRPSMERLRDVLALIFLAAILSTLVSATIGTVSSRWGGVLAPEDFFPAWGTWWLGDMTGNLVLASFLFTWSALWPIRPKPSRIVEGVVLVGVLVCVAGLAFGSWFPQITMFHERPYVIFPFMIWAALRFGPPGATATILLASTLAIWNTTGRTGPFVKDTLNQSLLSLQSFLGFLAVTALVLAAVFQERRRAESALQEKTEALERSNKELEQFAHVASHDLQEPLAKILAFGDLLKSEKISGMDEEGRQYIERMQHAAHRMRQLIEDLLQYSRISIARTPWAPVDLEKVIEEVRDDLEVKFAQTGARLEVGHLPPVHGDPPQWRQLFQNLVGNALKFRGKDQAPSILIRSEPLKNGSLKITVEDKGIGFEEKYLDRIFEPFERLHSASEYPGSGMGLAICKKIVERHGGVITAQSEPGKGTIFTITLPRFPGSVRGS